MSLTIGGTMEIYNEQMELIQNPDLSLGYITTDIMQVHHPAIQQVKEQFHYETIAVYPNGGKDIKKVIDVQGVQASPAYTEQVIIQKYVLYTQEELDRIQEKNNTPSDYDRLQAQILYTALITDTLLTE